MLSMGAMINKYPSINRKEVVSPFPRIVSNGKRYRIEWKNGHYVGQKGYQYLLFETRFLWVAKIQLRRLEKWLMITRPEFKPLNAFDEIVYTLYPHHFLTPVMIRSFAHRVRTMEDRPRIASDMEAYANQLESGKTPTHHPE